MTVKIDGTLGIGEIPGIDLENGVAIDDTNGDMILKTGDVEKARLTQEGDLGIGTTAPAASLDISSAGNGDDAIVVKNSSDPAFRLATSVISNSIDSSVFRVGLNYLNQKNAGISFVRGNSVTGGYLKFDTSDGTEHMRLTNDGNLGLGTSNPTARLHVSGDAIIDNGQNTTLTIKSDNNGRSQISLIGDSQGTGRVYVGQSSTFGGGIEYNGDSSPTTTGAGSDYITLYRRDSNVDSWTARNRQNSNNWEFRGDITVSGGDITLGGTGRIQGIDTVSASTDATSKSYVDSQVNTRLTQSTADARYVNVSGDTMTGKLILGSNNIDFKTGGNSTVPQIRGHRSSVDLNDRRFASEGGLSWTTFNQDAANRPVSGVDNANGVLTLNTHTGEQYCHQVAYSSNGEVHHRYNTGAWNRIFQDNYHPNADKLTTARTITLTGDASGSVSFDGSQNVSIPVTVADNSHNHTSNSGNYTVGGDLTVSGGDIILGGTGRIQGIDTVSATTDATNKSYVDGRVNTRLTQSTADGRYVRKNVGFQWTGTGGNALSFRSNDTIDTSTGDQAALEVYQDTAGADAFMQFHVGGDYAKYFGLHGEINDFVIGGWSSGSQYQRLFHDGYHPNADKLTTARTISLSGDLLGSASFDGSSNITISASVGNDSHTHDSRYYTKAQSDARFLRDAPSRTTLFSGNTGAGTINLSEAYTNFDYLEVYLGLDNGQSFSSHIVSVDSIEYARELGKDFEFFIGTDSFWRFRPDTNRNRINTITESSVIYRVIGIRY